MTTNLVNKLRQVRTKSNHKSHQMSCVILRQGKPVAFAFNRTEGNSKVRRLSKVKGVHAELSAIFSIKDKSILRNCTIVVYREDKNGQANMARPCPMCLEVIRSQGIKTVIYSTSEGWVEECVK